MGRLVRRSVVRSWEPCAGVSENPVTLHPLSSGRPSHPLTEEPSTSAPAPG